MLGVIGCLLLTASGAAAGENAVYRLKKREDELRELSAIMSKIDICITSCRLDTAGIFRRISEEKGSYSSFFVSDDVNITECVSSLIRTSGLEMCEAFADLIARFGHTDIDGQLAQNALFRAEVNTALEKAHMAREKYTRIYRAAGISAGLTAALILI
ncbi:stage III sporulation protein AB [Ruminococcus albus]|uniref:Stage III sporulation protein AB n=1 Tax=Ruminococcus albus TaxID=1264 RepID=A0A1H7FIM6_RUMAL|nr:stage III sporulation protein AB [Ruminococcus albus]SEK25829.1 stage III sporulation protein AB [Ruminococcus albus]